MRFLIPVLVGVALLGGAPAVGAAATTPLAEAPAFSLSDLDGRTFDLAALRGKLVVLHFATSWCPFCNAEATHLEALRERYRDRGVEVLVVDVGEKPETVSGWTRQWKLSVPVLLDADGSVAARYAPADTLPELARDQVMIASNLLIDRDGRIRFFSLLDTKAFDPRLTALTARLEELLAER